MSSIGKPVCVREYESLAQQVLPRPIFNFIRGGAEEQSTVGDNENAFKRYRFLPRMLCGVSKPSLETVVLGQRVSMPIGVAPMGMQKLVDPDGEMATARAVQSMDTIMVVSTVSSCSMEEVAAAAPRAIKWFQLYILDNQEYSRQLVQRAEKSGFQAIVLTADAPRIGKRWDTQRDSFVLPAHVKLPHLTQGADSLGNISDRMVPALTWSTVAWLCSITKLPVLVKGILTAEDAVLAARHGAAGVFVSNHRIGPVHFGTTFTTASISSCEQASRKEEHLVVASPTSRALNATDTEQRVEAVSVHKAGCAGREAACRGEPAHGSIPASSSTDPQSRPVSRLGRGSETTLAGMK